MNRENVIKGLEQFKADFKPFCGNGSDWARIDDAISMLKEQDDLGAELTNAVELIHKKNERIKELPKEQEAVPVIQREVMHMLVWCCGSCGVAITDGDNFCRNCGKGLKWDE